MDMLAQWDVPDRHEAEKRAHKVCAAYRRDKGQTRRRELFRGLSPADAVQLITAELGAPRAQPADLFGPIESQWLAARVIIKPAR
jgi:hypothetical protein